MGVCWRSQLRGTLEESPAAGRPAAPAAVDERALGRARAIVCAHCGHAITSDAERIAIQQSHQHRFMNPVGTLFHIGCFGRAPGCAVIGAPSDDYPWFAGYSWQLALCGGCAGHLGWWFQSPDGGFFGLRLDQLRAGGD
jgi:hypothetical protein